MKQFIVSLIIKTEDDELCSNDIFQLLDEWAWDNDLSFTETEDISEVSKPPKPPKQ
jgi:hypothetical protein